MKHLLQLIFKSDSIDSYPTYINWFGKKNVLRK